MDDPNKSLEVILKNIVNETYAKDISKKVSSSHQMRLKQGGFICGLHRMDIEQEKMKMESDACIRMKILLLLSKKSLMPI